MQLRSLLPAALALAASAGAFLVPPNTDGDAIDAFNSHPVDSGKAAGIRIPCPGCYVTEDAFKDTDLLLEFSQKDNKIYLGQTPVYPLNPAAASAMGKQVKAEDSDFDMADTDVHLSTRMEVVNTVPLNDKGLTVSEFRLEVLGIDDRVVHVGTVSFAVFDHHDDKTVAMSEPKLIPTVTTLADASCTTILCRVRAQIAAKVAALKAAAGKFKSGCMRMMGMHPHGPHHHHHGHHGHPEEKVEDVSADRTEQAPPSKPMDRLKGGPEKIKGMMGGKKPCAGRHGAIRKLIHGVAVFAKHVLMPVLVGVAAGMAVSAFGMVVGQLIFMIVTRLRARRNGGYVAVYQVVSEDDIDDLEARLEKNVEDEIDPLPRYEAGEHVLPPAYDEKRDGEQH